MEDSQSDKTIEAPKELSSKESYKSSLADFDAALCEGCAVSQAIASRNVYPSLGYATHVFVRILAHGRNLICSVPKNRWSRSDHEVWDFGSNASNFRTIMEAALLFYYLSDADPNADTQRAIVQLMHLYDLTKRTNIIHGGQVDAETAKLREEIISRLESTQKFKSLDQKLKKSALKGARLMIESREEIMARKGWDKDWFDLLWNITSQYTHVQSLAFYRIEPNGRGTGIENRFDRGFLALGLVISAEILTGITDALCVHFPDASKVRLGSSSKFSPGPPRNLPRDRKRARKKAAPKV